jgi:ATP-dependent Clp protease ATP-binding subunit ClpC
MFEHYSKKARRSIFFARYEASQLGCRYIETEHVLLGILREDQDLARRLLGSTETIEDIRKAIEANRPAGAKPGTSVDLPLGKELKRVLAQAAREAEQYQHRQIGCEHLLLGLWLEEKTLASRILREQGVTAARLQDQMMRLPRASAAGRPPAAEPASAPYFRDLSAAAKDGTLGPMIGRKRELDRVIQILSRRTRNNPALIGEAGVGKSAIVCGLAQRIAANDVPPFLENRLILATHAASLVDRKHPLRSGVEFQELLSSHATYGQAILFVEGLFNLAAVRSSWGTLEAASALEPYLSGGRLQCIATGSRQGLELMRNTPGTLARHFEAVEVEPPDEEVAVKILYAVKPQYESFHGVSFGEGTIEAAVHASGRFLRHRFLPDRAIDLIDEAGARAKLRRDQSDRTVTPQDVEEAVAERLGVPLTEVRKLLELRQPNELRTVTDELLSRMPADSREWMPLLAGYLVRCSREEADKLAEAVQAAKAKVSS